MLATDVPNAERLLNHLGLLNESRLIVKVRGIAEINVRFSTGWRWIVGVPVDKDRFLALMQAEIDDCLAQLEAIGVEVPNGDEDKVVAGIRSWA